ncbi:MAG: ribonuclease HII [Marinilabiliales bacterium]
MLKRYFNKNKIEAGIDEAGRGCLAGPVVAAAVILPDDYYNSELNDSKKLTEKQRYNMRNDIIQNAISYSVVFVDNKVIDKINILNATYKAMNEAVKNLGITPEFLIIDGNRFKNQTNIDYKCIVKGDSLYSSIAAASILAKTFRDDYMTELHEIIPEYKLNKNKGYATAVHVEAIRKYGYSPYHRKSFHLKSDQLKLDF